MFHFIDASALKCMTFTYIDHRTGKATHFNVDKINERLKGRKVHRLDIDRAWGKHALRHMGIEQKRLDAVLQIEGEYDPVSYVQFDSQYHVLVDGSHRYVASYLRKRPHIYMRYLPYGEWQDCVINLPELENPYDWIGGRSGK